MKSQLRIDDNLFERLCDVTSLELGFKTVRRNKGSAGADGVTIEAFAANLDEELGLLQKELCNWTYKPKPVKRVAIPKPSGGERLLGIPSVRDRVVQATLKSLIEPLFESKFSDNSYGFRPGRDQKQAVSKAQSIVSSGKEFVVDIDLEQFFDRICHDRLMHRLGLTIEDKSILKIIAKILRSGVLSNGIFSQTQSGSPQGGPLSPLLSNVVLDELDHELERRDLEFCRYADDCNIFVKSQKAADRVLASISKFIVGR